MTVVGIEGRRVSAGSATAGVRLRSGFRDRLAGGAVVEHVRQDRHVDEPS